MRHETDKEVTFVYVYGRWLKRLQVSVDHKASRILKRGSKYPTGNVNLGRNEEVIVWRVRLSGVFCYERKQIINLLSVSDRQHTSPFRERKKKSKNRRKIPAVWKKTRSDKFRRRKDIEIFKEIKSKICKIKLNFSSFSRRRKRKMAQRRKNDALILSLKPSNT